MELPPLKSSDIAGDDAKQYTVVCEMLPTEELTAIHKTHVMIHSKLGGNHIVPVSMLTGELKNGTSVRTSRTGMVELYREEENMDLTDIERAIQSMKTSIEKGEAPQASAAPSS